MEGDDDSMEPDVEEEEGAPVSRGNIALKVADVEGETAIEVGVDFDEFFLQCGDDQAFGRG